MRNLLFKGEYNSIKDACELEMRDCDKCPLNDKVEVYIPYECYNYELTICELMEGIEKP